MDGGVLDGGFRFQIMIIGSKIGGGCVGIMNNDVKVVGCKFVCNKFGYYLMFGVKNNIQFKCHFEDDGKVEDMIFDACDKLLECVVASMFV